jgi:hypothetical protein
MFMLSGTCLYCLKNVYVVRYMSMLLGVFMRSDHNGSHEKVMQIEYIHCEVKARTS